MSKSSIICQIRQQKADGVSHFRQDGCRFYRSSHTRKNIKAFAVGMVRGPARANCVKICLEIADFRKGSNATESDLLGYVRFTPGSDRTADIRDRQLRAIRRLMHRNK
jgi:hypothetical protein